MIGIILFGHSKMGREITGIIETSTKMEIAEEGKNYEKMVVIDFSHPIRHDEAVSFAEKSGLPLICGTTGLSGEQFERMRELAKQVPLLYSSNFSYGISVIKKLLRESAELLKGWDTEMVETHHNQKKDMPSGTAKTLTKVLEDVQGAGAVNVHSLRGGTVAGVHQVQFFGADEIIEIKHTAISRRIFAEGACMTVEKIIKFEPGFYSFDEIVTESKDIVN